MPEAEPLFSKAVVMSACTEHFFTEEESRRNTRLLLKLLKIKENHLDELYSVDDERLIKAIKKYETKILLHMDIRCAFSPVIDGKTLKGEPELLCTKSSKPLLIGTVKDEANSFTLKLPSLALRFMSKGLKLDPENYEAEDYRHRVSKSVTQIVYRKPADRILASYKGKAWSYLYTYSTPDYRKNGLECCHACDVAVLLGKDNPFQKVQDPETVKVTEKLQGILKEFAFNSKVSWEEHKKSRFIQLLP